MGFLLKRLTVKVLGGPCFTILGVGSLEYSCGITDPNILTMIVFRHFERKFENDNSVVVEDISSFSYEALRSLYALDLYKIDSDLGENFFFCSPTKI